MRAVLANRALLKEFFKYISSGVLAMIAMSCYILADTFFVSLGLGADGLTALNLAIPVYYFMHGTGLMLGMGAATKYSVYKSRGEDVKANAIFTGAVLLGALFSEIFVVTGAAFSGGLAKLLGADDSTYEMTEVYIKVLLLFSPAFVFNNILACFVRNDGAPRIAMLSTVAGSLSNVLLDYVFIFPCKMGMFGAVFATGLAPVIGICVSSVHIFLRKNNFRFIKTIPSMQSMGAIFVLGLPSLVEQFSSAIVILVFNFLILGIGGNVAVAAYGIVANISLVVASVFTGMAQGIQPIISRCHGEGKTAAARSCFVLAVVLAAAFSVAVYAVIFFFAEPIAAIFNSGGNSALAEMAADGMRIYFTAIIFLGFNVIACTFFTSSERPLPAHIVSLLRGLILIIPAAFMFSHLFWLTGVWLSYPVTEAAVAIIAAIILIISSRRENKSRLLKGATTDDGNEQNCNLHK